MVPFVEPVESISSVFVTNCPVQIGTPVTNKTDGIRMILPLARILTATVTGIGSGSTVVGAK
jgi:hypothetical protein